MTNEHWGLTFFWAAISALLPSSVKSKITFAGTNFQKILRDVVSDEHPYFRYMIDVQLNSNHKVPLPASSPYLPHCRQASEYCNDDDLEEAGSHMQNTLSFQSTAASLEDSRNTGGDEETFWDCREETDDEDGYATASSFEPRARSNWTSIFGCACCSKAIDPFEFVASRH